MGPCMTDDISKNITPKPQASHEARTAGGFLFILVWPTVLKRTSHCHLFSLVLPIDCWIDSVWEVLHQNTHRNRSLTQQTICLNCHCCVCLFCRDALIILSQLSAVGCLQHHSTICEEDRVLRLFLFTSIKTIKKLQGICRSETQLQICDFFHSLNL